MVGLSRTVYTFKKKKNQFLYVDFLFLKPNLLLKAFYIPCTHAILVAVGACPLKHSCLKFIMYLYPVSPLWFNTVVSSLWWQARWKVDQCASVCSLRTRLKRSLPPRCSVFDDNTLIVSYFHRSGHAHWCVFVRGECEQGFCDSSPAPDLTRGPRGSFALSRRACGARFLRIFSPNGSYLVVCSKKTHP